MTIFKCLFEITMDMYSGVLDLADCLCGGWDGAVFGICAEHRVIAKRCFGYH